MKIEASLKQQKNVLVIDCNVKRMDENTAHEGEEKEWGKILNGSKNDWGRYGRKVCRLAASQTKANADARPPAVGSKSRSVRSFSPFYFGNSFFPFVYC